MKHAEQIMRAVAHLTQVQGFREFSRRDVRERLGVDAGIWHNGYVAIFQGMRVDHPGGAPSVGERYVGVFRRVRYGRYALTDKGQTQVAELRASN
jgi:hypothetical protein